MSLKKQLEKAREDLALAVRLLEPAACPDPDCGGRGWTEHFSARYGLELGPCQWCDEKKKLLDEYK